jgi:hypothetical protein
MTTNLTTGSTVPTVSFTSSTLKLASLSTITPLTVRFHPFSFHPPFLRNPFSLPRHVLFHLRRLPTLPRFLPNYPRNIIDHYLLLHHPCNVLILLRNLLFYLPNIYFTTHLRNLKIPVHCLVVYQFHLRIYLRSLLLRLFSIEI